MVGDAVRTVLSSQSFKKILTPPLPANKEKNARNGMPAGFRDTEILGLVDLTLFGSAKNALVFTAEYCFIVDGDESWQFGWNEVSGVEGFTGFAEDTIGLRLTDGTRKLYAGTAGQDVLRLLEAVVAARGGAAETSPGGSRVLRHTSAVPPPGDVAHADDARITAHIETHLGPGGMVWHEIISENVHLDVHVAAPTEERPYYVLVTSGMSARPMNVPPDLPEADAWRRAELCIFLPPDWPMTQEAFEDERHYWPIRMLKTLARLPHEFDTWLGWGHSIPNGNPPAPYAPGVPFTGALVIPPFALADFYEVAGEPPMHVFQILPVTSAEMDLKLEVGLDDALSQMEADHPDLYGPVDISRPTATGT